MSINCKPILDAAASHALSLGYFDRVNQHEPKSSPGYGLSAAIWVQFIRPTRSGLNSTSIILDLNVRIYLNMLQEPQDMIDPNMVDATDALMNAYSGDFDLKGTIAYVDLLGGEDSDGLEAEAGYVEMDNVLHRVMTIRVPCLINDVWSQAQ